MFVLLLLLLGVSEFWPEFERVPVSVFGGAPGARVGGWVAR